MVLQLKKNVDRAANFTNDAYEIGLSLKDASGPGYENVFMVYKTFFVLRQPKLSEVIAQVIAFQKQQKANKFVKERARDVCELAKSWEDLLKQLAALKEAK